MHTIGGADYKLAAKGSCDQRRVDLLFKTRDPAVLLSRLVLSLCAAQFDSATNTRSLASKIRGVLSLVVFALPVSNVVSSSKFDTFDPQSHAGKF